MEILTDLYSIAILVGATALTVSVVAGVYFFVQQKKSEEVTKWAALIVSGLQQKMKLVDGPRKFELAMIALRAVRDRVGAKLSDEQLEMLIEANVYLAKQMAAVLPGDLDDKLVNALVGDLEKK